jgi:hypothetical protein
MKKAFFTLVTLILIIVISWSVYYHKSKEAVQTDQDTSITDTDISPTQSPTQAPDISPTNTPEPTIAPQEITTLYPAYQSVEGETKFGYINESGVFVIQPTFTFASDFHDGVAIVIINDNYCMIDSDGNVLYISNNAIRDASNGLAVFSSSDGSDTTLYGYLDTKGNIVIEPIYPMATDFMGDHTAYVSTETGKYALIDNYGKILESYELDTNYGTPWSLQDGYIIYTVTGTGKYGVINVKGEEILEPIYSEINYLGENLFSVKKPEMEFYSEIMNAPLALFNSMGEQITDYSLYDIGKFDNGTSSATDNTSTFFIGTDGKEIKGLPRYDGRGTLRLLGEVIKADIDQDLIYTYIDKSLLWQFDDVISLSEDIKVLKMKYKPSRYILVHYPQIEGLQDAATQQLINSEIMKLFVDSRTDLMDEGTLSVEDSFQAKLVNNLLIIERDGYDYYFGAAHGMPIRDYYYIDIRTGTLYQLKDLFKADSDYMTKINELITADIKFQTESEDSMFFPESFLGIKENQYFILEEEALTIYFYPYDIAAYAAGFPEFLIPFDDISEYLDKEGAFWSSFH